MKSFRHYQRTVWFWLRFWCHRALDGALAGLERPLPERMLPRHCPCCGWRGLAFRGVVYGEYSRRGALCPNCGAFERHRAMGLFYPRLFGGAPSPPARALHFSAEPFLAPVLRPLFGRYVRSTYDDPGPAELRLDLMDLGLRDASCDAFLLHHVLDSTPDDRRAASELYRALRAPGIAVATIALDGQPTTEELTTPHSTGRRRLYGPGDLAERFAPFEVSIVNAAARIDRAQRRRVGIPPDVAALLLRKKEPPRPPPAPFE